MLDILELMHSEVQELQSSKNLCDSDVILLYALIEDIREEYLECCAE